MATNVIMPKQGLQMTEGTIIQWFAAEGDSVSEGTPLFEMETDKLTIEIDAPASGTLLKIIHGEGDVVPITHIIAVIGEQGEEIGSNIAEAESQDGGSASGGGETDSDRSIPTAVSPAPVPAPPSASESTLELRSDGQQFSTPRARWRAQERGISLSSVSGTGPDGLVIERDVLEALEAQPAATPVARRVAELSGVPLDEVQGTGRGGKIYKRDVEAAASRTGSVPARAPAGASREDRIVPLAGMRKVIAQRMRESLDTAAQVVHRISVDMSEAVRLRTRLKAADVSVSYNDIIVRATAHALTLHPRMNSALTNEGIIEFGSVNIGIAVALEDGLIVPVLHDADALSLAQIHAETARLAEAARGGALTQDNMSGGTFSVSNLGMYGLDSFTAIIDTPQSGILAVGAIKDRVVPVDGEAVIRPVCELSLTYDHRVVDGAPAAQFIKTLAETLENPYTLL